MIVLKRNYTHAHFNDAGMVQPAADIELQGLYLADVRLFKHYEWALPSFRLLHQQSNELSQLVQHWSVMEHHDQTVGLKRTVSLSEDQITDTLQFTNYTDEPIQLTLQLHCEFDHQDLMQLRGIGTPFQPEHCAENHLSIKAHYLNGDLHCAQMSIRVNDQMHEPNQSIAITLPANQSTTLTVNILFSGYPTDPSLPSWTDWIEPFIHNDCYKSLDITQKMLLRKSLSDLYGLLFSTKQGLVIAAGLPRFTAPFGRDSLITAFFLLKQQPLLAQGVLTFLACHIGTQTDPNRDEEPGKILHEYRFGPNSQNHHIPFAPYYGSADATSLFLTLLQTYCEQTKDWPMAKKLQPAWQAAYHWIEHKIQQGNGWIRSHKNPQGLVFQGWKDSPKAMRHADGSIAKGDIAVIEVQGYAVAALRACEQLFQKIDEAELAAQAEHSAQALTERIHGLWDPALGSHGYYPMGLDGHDRPMQVISSNVGHLLWSNVVTTRQFKAIKKQLFEPTLFSGWGFRTLAEDSTAFNPVAYHNGSVWPHDTALIAWGLLNYGDKEGYTQIKETIECLAKLIPDHRLPELISGYARTDDTNQEPAAIPYPGTCSPQAWAAAVLPFFYGT